MDYGLTIDGNYGPQMLLFLFVVVCCFYLKRYFGT
jgi:hypothetical protein